LFGREHTSVASASDGSVWAPKRAQEKEVFGREHTGEACAREGGCSSARPLLPPTPLAREKEALAAQLTSFAAQINDENLVRYKAEILLMADLHHANVVALVGAVWETDLMALVMEYCENGMSTDVLSDESVALTWADPLLRWTIDITKAMKYLHASVYYDTSSNTTVKGIVHRDLKVSWRGGGGGGGGAKGGGSNTESGRTLAAKRSQRKKRVLWARSPAPPICSAPARC
jgi:serine/threonine protein kinase